MPKRVATSLVGRSRSLTKSPTRKKAIMPPAKKPRAAPNSHILPEPIPNGTILTDVAKKQWRIGKSIGVGGFGEIYAASDNVTKAVSLDATYVVKIEPHNNGPLFTEMHFYQRAAKAEMIDAWKAKKKLKFLGMPKFIAFGSHDLNGTRYRFMVIERFGEDVQKKFEQSNRQFSTKLSFTLALKIIDILEYIHETGYVHADIKGSNLLLGFGRENEVFLVDYGLACKYTSNGIHKPFSEDPRKAHNGTIEFTSRDAHVGVASRRGDMEILGFNVLQWLCGKLPWEDSLKNPEEVKTQKLKFMDNIPSLMKACFKTNSSPDAIKAYLQYVSHMKFDETPDYSACRKMFVDGIKQSGAPNDSILSFVDGKKKSPKKRGKAKLVVEEEEDVDSENNEPETPAKQRRNGLTRPCALAQANRLKKTPPKSRSKLKVVSDLKKPTKAVNSSIAVGTSPVIIPTPAMLEVMRMRKEMIAKATVAKKVTKHSRRRSNTCSSSSEVDTPTRRPLRRTRRERTSRSMSTSSDYMNRTVSPDLF